MLTLALVTWVTCASLPRTSYADPGSLMTDPGDISNPGGGGGPGGNGIGDPDVPDGSGRLKKGALGRGGMTGQSRSVGDGRLAAGGVVWRLYVAWVGTRSYWLHF